VKLSAGIVLYRVVDDGLEVLLGHMGGPFWARKDEGAWSIPKGEYAEGEEPRAAATREFHEEMGAPLPEGELVDLGVFKQSSAKQVTAFALEADFDADNIVSNTFETEWPPRSGRLQSFPEIDRAAWFDVETARTKLVKGQVPILDRLTEVRKSR
jgi:predicted NUDIX family NTP pyrophosphohydrolase